MVSELRSLMKFWQASDICDRLQIILRKEPFFQRHAMQQVTLHLYSAGRRHIGFDRQHWKQEIFYSEKRFQVMCCMMVMWVLWACTRRSASTGPILNNITSMVWTWRRTANCESQEIHRCFDIDGQKGRAQWNAVFRCCFTCDVLHMFFVTYVFFHLLFGVLSPDKHLWTRVCNCFQLLFVCVSLFCSSCAGQEKHESKILQPMRPVA